MTEWLERDIIITGERVSNAAASFDQNGQPNVQITLDGEGGMLMSRATRANVKRRMGVLLSSVSSEPHMTSTKMARPLLFVNLRREEGADSAGHSIRARRPVPNHRAG